MIDDTEPTADFAGTPTSGLKPLTVDFSDSSTSYDGIAAWDWDFGDGDTSTEQNPSHVYATEGSYTVSLTVYEADGNSDTKAKVDYIIVTWENQPPVSDPNGPYSGIEGAAILFCGSGSYDPDGSIISFAWDFGDGNTGTGESPAYTYAQNGTYNVTLVVTDNEGATDTKTTTATIDDTEPTADFAGTPTSGLKPLAVDFSDSSTSYDGIAAWEWDFGDGYTSTEQNPTHVYTTEDSYTVSFAVYEADGDSDTEAKVDYINVTRENQPPVSDPNGPYMGTEGVSITFSSSGSYDPDGSIISFVWDFGFGDGNTGTGESPAYTYAQNGTYNVTLTVTDDEGATDTSTTTATIDYTEPIADLSFELNPSGINFGAVVIGIEKIVSATITNTGNCPAKVTVTKGIMKGMSHGDTIPVSALGVNGNYVDNPVIVSSSLGCKESVTVKFAIHVPVGTLADIYTEGFTITVSQA
jgi:PKD repeat protein